MLKLFKETKANLLINFYLQRRKIVHYIYANEKFFPELTFPQIEHSLSLRNELFLVTFNDETENTTCRTINSHILYN